LQTHHPSDQSREPLRVAYLVNQYPKISHSFIRREIQALEGLGVEVLRVAVRGWDGELSDEQDELERKKTRFILGEGVLALLRAVLSVTMRRPAKLLSGLALAWQMARRAEKPLPVHLVYLAEACLLRSWLQSWRALHLHAHFGTNSAEVAMLVHQLGGPRWSFTVHGPEEFDKALIIGLAEKVNRCAFVAAISSYGRSQIYRLIDQVQWPKVHVIPCGVDASYFSAAPVPIPETRRLVCIGRLCEQKGQMLLVEAARRLTESGIDFELVLAGDGEMRKDIEAAIVHNRLQDRMRIIGWISGEAVRQELLSARALVLPSFAEGLPVVLMEAMALRRPVISTYIGGIPELVRPEEHGWLVPAGDVDALVDAMRACLAAPAHLLYRMGEAAHKRVCILHNVNSAAENLAALFAHQP
jgi:glycosyltransferase involved in cell wall biosynthesis